MSDKKKLAIAVTALSDINRVQRQNFDMTTVGAISAKAFADMAKIKPLKGTGLIDPSKTRKGKVNLTPRGTPFFYEVIGTKTEGYVKESDLLDLANQLRELKKSIKAPQLVPRMMAISPRKLQEAREGQWPFPTPYKPK